MGRDDGGDFGGGSAYLSYFRAIDLEICIGVWLNGIEDLFDGYGA